MTKFALIAALTASVAAASAASADSNFSFDAAQNSGSILELGVVNSAADGVIEVYDYRLGEQGKLLAVESVHAGANRDTRINLNSEPFGDVLAVLKSGGQVLATQLVDVRAN